MKESTLTKRGQVSLPAELRRKLRLRPGQKLQFEVVSDNDFRVFVRKGKIAGPMAMLGFARRIRPVARRTKNWMKELRNGEA